MLVRHSVAVCCTSLCVYCMFWRVVVQAAAAQKGQEVRELNHMLKAWEAMRLGKDAQVCLQHMQ